MGEDLRAHNEERLDGARPNSASRALSLFQVAAVLVLMWATKDRSPRERDAPTVSPSPTIDPEKQLAFFKILYDEEVAREKLLNEHAKNNLTLVTLYSGFVLFVIEKIRPVDLTSKVLFILASISMIGAFLFSLRSSAIAEFEALNDPKEVATAYRDRPRVDDFCDDRIADYVVATQRNSLVNDRKARRLRLAGYLLLVGLVFHGLYFAVQVTVTPTGPTVPASTPGAGQAAPAPKTP